MNDKTLKGVCEGVLPFFALSIFTATVFYCNGRNYGLVLACEGKEIAAVKDEEIYEKANRMIMDQIVVEGDKAEAMPYTRYELTVVDEPACESPVQVKDKILAGSHDSLEEGYGLYVDGIMIGALREESDLTGLLDSLKNEAKSGEDETSVDFVENVEIVKGLYLTSDLSDYDELSRTILDGVPEKHEYTVRENDDLNSVAKSLGVSEKQLEDVEGVNWGELNVGDKLSFETSRKVIGVRVVKIENETIEIPFESVREEDPSQYRGRERVTRQGQNGTEEIIRKVTYVNGEEESREEISHEVLSEPVNERISYGTKEEVKKEKPKKSDNTKKSSVSDVGDKRNSQSGKLCWPVPHTKNITSGYGPRDGEFHDGIDIASCGVDGKDIVAAADGVVTSVVSSGVGYGNHVRISHSNGMVTLYAHCKSTCVSVGQKVSRGQKIASVGSTGKSTGPHCHFGVSVNKKSKNPSDYL